MSATNPESQILGIGNRPKQDACRMICKFLTFLKANQVKEQSIHNIHLRIRQEYVYLYKVSFLVSTNASGELVPALFTSKSIGPMSSTAFLATSQSAKSTMCVSILEACKQMYNALNSFYCSLADRFVP